MRLCLDEFDEPAIVKTERFALKIAHLNNLTRCLLKQPWNAQQRPWEYARRNRLPSAVEIG